MSFLLLAGLASPPIHAAEAPRPLRFAMEDYPPFEYELDGHPAGINVEVTTRIMTRLGLPFECRFYPFTRSWLMLTKGREDAAPSISYEKSREPFLFYTDAQKAFATTGDIPEDHLWLTEYVFFVSHRLENSLRFDSYAQIKRDNYRIGINTEYTYHPAFWEAGLQTREFATPAEAFKALANGEIDLFPMDRTIGLWLLKRMGMEAQISYLARPLFAKPYLMVFSRVSDYPDLEGVMQRYYAELKAMRARGEYKEIYERYIQQIGANGAARPLRFVCEEWAPFEYMANGEVKGIDVEVTDRIMRKLGIPYEIQIYPWSRAWMLVEHGQADAVLSVSYNAAREKDLYYTPEQAAFAASGIPPPDHLWVADYVFFVKKKHAQSYLFESYDQIKAAGYRVGTNKDYTYNDAFCAAALSVREYPDAKSGVAALVADEIDLYPMVRTVGLAVLKEMGLTESVTWLPKPLFSKPYLAPFCRRSDYPHLEHIMYAYYRELNLMRKNGSYQEIYNRYVGALQDGDAPPAAAP